MKFHLLLVFVTLLCMETAECLEISSNGIALVKHFEGCRLTAYQDSVGVWTIGWGHTGGVKKGDHWSQKKADDMLKADLKNKAARYVEKYVKVPLNQNQFDALVSWTYNLGAGSLRSSTMLKRLNNREYTKVPAEIRKWKYAGGKVLKGLERRRNAEAALFAGKNWRDYKN